ncbi:MAG: GerMN domain-containing protein [Lachnospiraceae bacterium]|nr:GerMN domain-containing protein [Lachnospiraceae bacterium]
MKKKKKMVLMVVIAMLALAACGNATGETATSETVTVPETSSGEFLVDSLKYLLVEEEIATEEQTVAEGQITSEEQISTEKMQTVIYYGNGASFELNTEVTSLEQLTAENLVAALAKRNIVSLDTKVNSFEEEENNGNKVLYLDLSKSFREYLETMTQEGECIIIASLTDTFLEAYDADSMVLMIDGSVLETAHASYEEPLEFYETKLVMDTEE